MSAQDTLEKASLDSKDEKKSTSHVALVTDQHVEITPEEERRLRRKIDLHLMPLMCVLYWIQFMDKTTLGSAAILGIKTSTHLTTNEYNWLGTIFYLSYLAFEYPQNLALQRFPVGKWMSLNIFVWGVALCSHAACKNFGGLFACRFILGICEGSITAGFMIVTSMFYTRKEQTLRIGYWCPQIVIGFISFGSLYIKTGNFKPWQWLVIITGILTLITSVCFFLMFPDSPTTAWFLTPEERVLAVQRLQANQTGVENKRWKREQFIEALTDPKTWLFAAFSAFDNVPNSLTNQQQLIIANFGFTTLQTTLLAMVNGFVEIATIFTGVNLAARLPNSRAYVGTIYFMPTMLGIMLQQGWTLFGQWMTGMFVLALSWLTNVTAGHTKKVTVNAIMLIAYCVGNAAGPFMWQAKYTPRNHIPWLIIGVCYATCMALLMAIRARAEPRDTTYDDVYVEVVLPDGARVERKVEKEY
ncbi:MFS general substrate transporter [Fomitopsis serialis]|uniref:MFS general substrate transporter n=1 Tax=Fomitopsis serialis TaxID=139415 RepID=UPI002007E552|nr:MFS general substrate transporter [Neoantrodia serialis]KAH9917079.1 MFS general substrate transporter [Neoantrodia serialis]